MLARMVNKSEELSFTKTTLHDLTWQSKQVKTNPENGLKVLFDFALVWLSYFKQHESF